MSPLPSADQVENSSDYFYSTDKRSKNRVSLLEALGDCQFRDVLADSSNAPKPTPIIVIKTNKIAELERVRQDSLQLPTGSIILLSVRLDARFVTASVPGKIWHAYHQGRFSEVADPQPIVDAFLKRQSRQPAIVSAPVNSSLAAEELKQSRALLASHKVTETHISESKAEVAESHDRSARQEVRHQTTRMELEGEILHLRFEIGKLKGKRRRKE